jgi:hypothetical protein
MGVTVPTLDEYEARMSALEARGSVLEAGAQPQPPDPTPPPDMTIEDAQAKRTADVIESFGVNTFSSLEADANLWGSWPADYSPGSVIDALRWITGDSGFALRLREYHYAGRADMQREWLHQVVGALPGTRVTMCVGANGSSADVPTMLALRNDAACGIQWFEGLNEPNTNFGSGEAAFAETMAIQQALHDGGKLDIMGPSIVAGMPHPEGRIEKYCGTAENLAALNALMSIGNGHLYPPDHTDARGSSMAEYIGGLWTAYAQKPIALTEYHPTLFNTHGHAPGQPGWSGKRDAFYTLTGLLRAAKCKVAGLWWYALFDYGAGSGAGGYTCGLFPRRHADEPRPAGMALRHLCAICADPGSDRRTFAPVTLAVTVSGLPAGADWDLYESSDHRFFIALWRSASEPGGEAVPVTVSFDAAPVSATEFNPLVSAEAVRTWNDAASVEVLLDAGVRILAIEAAVAGRRRRARKVER